MKKLFAIIVVVAIAVLFYTEKTGKTNLQGMFSQYVLGIDQSESQEGDDDTKYQLAKPENKPKWDAGKEAIKDADSYHKEAKDFANKTNNAVNAINEADK